MGGGASIKEIQEAAGHKAITMSARYAIPRIQDKRMSVPESVPDFPTDDRLQTLFHSIALLAWYDFVRRRILQMRNEWWNLGFGGDGRFHQMPPGRLLVSGSDGKYFGLGEVGSADHHADW
jgi:hypothetical protein